MFIVVRVWWITHNDEFMPFACCLHNLLLNYFAHLLITRTVKRSKEMKVVVLGIL